jgi:heme-degrading monooxygenase HmoA
MAMSLIVCVKHFLAPNRADDFEQTFREHKSLVSKWDGFVSLRLLKPIAYNAAVPAQDPADSCDERVLIMEFQSEAQLRRWRASDEHTRIGQQYRSMWARPADAQYFLTEE